MTLDANGWTVFTASPDSRTYYVSNTGSDTNDGLSPDTSFATISKALSKIRNGYPDWVLLKHGDQFTADLQLRKGGRSADEPMLITGYGEGPRPIINGQGFFYSGTNQSDTFSLNHLALVGIDFRAVIGVYGKGIDLLGGVNNLLIEGNSFSDYRVQFQMGKQSVGVPVQNVTIRRNTFSNAREQGLLLNDVQGLVFEENIVDSSGYGGGYGTETGEEGPTIFKHNVYLNHNKNVTIRNNIFSRGSNFGLKLAANSGEPGSFTDFVVENNLFFNNGFSTSHSSGLTPGITTYMFQRGTVRNNVFTELGREFVGGSKQDMAAYLQNMEDVQFVGNVFAHKPAFADNPMFMWGQDDRHKDITISESIVFDWNLGEGRPSTRYFEDGAYTPEPLPGGVTNLQLSNNQIDVPAENYADPTRTVGSYNVTLGGTSSAADFLLTARSMSKANWNTAYTADALNSYIRAGFSGFIPTPDPVPTPDIVPDPDPVPEPKPDKIDKLTAAWLAAAQAFVAALETD